MDNIHASLPSVPTRPSIKVRAESSTSASTAPTSPGPRSPVLPQSPDSISSPKESSFPFFGGRSLGRASTIDSFMPARSKSPIPPAHHLPPSELKQSDTTPTSPSTGQRHKSDGAINPRLSSDRRDSFFQKKQQHKGSLSHYGRHGDAWLFGGVSIRETAKSLVKKNDK